MPGGKKETYGKGAKAFASEDARSKGAKPAPKKAKRYRKTAHMI